MAKIIDCFTFFNELDILDIRIAELAPVVDEFVVVESRRDYRGRPRSLVFDSVRDRFESTLAKITYVVVDDPPSIINPWMAEYAQRNAIRRGLTDIADGDIILISDVDEIPRRNSLALIGNVAAGDIVGLEMSFFYYGLNWVVPVRWNAARATSGQTLKWLTPQEIRMMTPTRSTPDAGWHLSYFFPRDKIYDLLRLKATSFAHSEFATDEFLNLDYLQLCVAGGLSWCSDPPFSVKLDYHHIDSSYPKLVLEDPARFLPYRREQHDRDLALEARARRLHRRVRRQTRLERARRLIGSELGGVMGARKGRERGR